MLFPGSSHKCLGDLQKASSKTDPLEKVSCKSANCPVLKQRDLENFQDFLKIFPKTPKELKLLGKVQAT